MIATPNARNLLDNCFSDSPTIPLVERPRLPNRWYDPTIGRWISEDPIEFEGDPSNTYRYVTNAPTNNVDPSGLKDVHCPPTKSEIDSGVAVAVGDLDGDGKTDYKFPKELSDGYTKYCFSGGNTGVDFYVTAPNGSYIHRCPYPDGKNDFDISPDPKDSTVKNYVGTVRNPHTKERTQYEYNIKKNTLTIKVYDKNGKPIRGQVITPAPKSPKELPMPENVPAL